MRHFVTRNTIPGTGTSCVCGSRLLSTTLDALEFSTSHCFIIIYHVIFLLLYSVDRRYPGVAQQRGKKKITQCKNASDIEAVIDV